jgi:pimeloyl-ACP methyl ester carboxylesterase
VHLLGHSLGGLVTREVLLARAARISSLTLMSSGPGALSGPRAQILQALLAELDGISPGQLGAEVERIWRTRMEPEAVSGNVPPAIIDFLRTRLLSSSPTGLRAMAETLLTCPDRTPALARLGSVPLMVLYGENDDAWDPAAQEDMAARLRAQRVCIPAAAHSPAVEAPETTASTLTSFWNATECQRARSSRSA